MATFNQVQFIGRLGRDPELQVTANGKPYARFSLAVDQGKDPQGKDKEAMWLNVTTWDKLAETVERYATKGMQVFVQGKLQLRTYTDKDKIERQAIDIVAFTVQMLDKRQNSNGAAAAPTPSEGDAFLPDFPDE